MSNTSLGTHRIIKDQHNVFTLASLGFLVYYITVMWHEVIGHGSLMYLFGCHHFVLTSTSIEASDVPSNATTGTLRGRLISMGGTFANLALGFALLPLLKRMMRRGTDPMFSIFLWLLVAVNIFIGFIYPLYSGVFGVADWSEAIVGLPQHGLLRAIEIAIGTALSCLTVWAFAGFFSYFPESLWRLSLIPYFSSAVVFCVAGLRIPNGTELMIISVIPAALIGQAILLLVTPIGRVRRKQLSSMGTVPLSLTAIVVAFLFVGVILLTAPGVHFSVP